MWYMWAGWTALHSAATRGHTCSLIRLVALGAHLEASDSRYSVYLLY
jgi:hypothetical protein